MATTQPELAIRSDRVPSNPKRLRVGIRLSTGIFAAIFTFSGALLLAAPPEAAASFRHLGYPDYFRGLLGVAKLLGVAALVVPLPSPTPREWAYAGCTFTCIAAAFSHAMSGDPGKAIVAPVFALAILMTSYVLRRRAARGAAYLCRGR